MLNTKLTVLCEKLFKEDFALSQLTVYFQAIITDFIHIHVTELIRKIERCLSNI